MRLVNSIDPLQFGFLPKREESLEAYQGRCKEIILNNEFLKVYFSKNLEGTLLTDKLIVQALDYFEQKTTLYPNWACMIYSNQGLGWLHLGALVETNLEIDQTKKISFIQLHERWKTREAYWGYSRLDVIAHELIHLVRYELEDEKYEEFISCQFEKKSFRKLGGALFSTPSSAMTIMVSLLITTISTGFICLAHEWFLNLPLQFMFFSWMALWFSLGAIFLIFLQFMHLLYRWLQFNRKAKEHIKDPRNFFLFSILIHSQDLEKLSKLHVKEWSGYLKAIPTGPYQLTLEQIWNQ